MNPLPIIYRLVACVGLFSPALATPSFATSDADALVALSNRSRAPRSISLQTVQWMLGGSRKKSEPDRSLTPEAVIARLGAPDAKVTTSLWVYWKYKAEDIPDCETGDTLVIEFRNDRVESVRFGRSEQVRAFIARLQIEVLKTKIAVR
jgi:hypothetical protein